MSRSNKTRDVLAAVARRSGSGEPISVQELAAEFNVQPDTVRNHLTIGKSAGFLRVVRRLELTDEGRRYLEENP